MRKEKLIKKYKKKGFKIKDDEIEEQLDESISDSSDDPEVVAAKVQDFAYDREHDPLEMALKKMGMKPEHCNIPDEVRLIKEPGSEGFDGEEENQFLDSEDQTNIVTEHDIREYEKSRIGASDSSTAE